MACFAGLDRDGTSRKREAAGAGRAIMVKVESTTTSSTTAAADTPAAVKAATPTKISISCNVDDPPPPTSANGHNGASPKKVAPMEQEGDLRVNKRKHPDVRRPPKLKKILVLVGVACVSALIGGGIGAAAATHGRAAPASDAATRPRNIIFMVSDGFGPASATLARVLRNRVYRPPPTESGGMQPLALDRFLTGQLHTYSASNLVTDSAAGATAWACGLKTTNLHVAVDPDERPRATLMEAAKAAGMATGVAVTSSVTDATPAAFATHARRRALQRSIALQLAVNRTADVVLGGGRSYFAPQQLEEAMRRPGGASAASATAASTAASDEEHEGYAVVHDRDGLLAAARAPLLGLFAEQHLPWEIDRRRQEVPSLAEMATKAVELLSRKGGDAGFFLLVEGSKIDKAAHPNDAPAHVREVLAYDDAVSAMLDFAARDGDTLVVSTSDHETGGVALGRGVVADADTAEAPLRTRSFAAEAKGALESAYDFDVHVLAGVTMSTEAMVAAALAEVGSPSGASLAANWTVRRQLSVELVTRLQNAARLGVLARHELAMVREAVDLYAELGAYGLMRAMGAVISARANIGWTTFGHTGVDVNLYATGPGSEQLRGVFENSELGARIERMMGWDLAALTATLGTPLISPLDRDDAQLANYTAWI